MLSWGKWHLNPENLTLEHRGARKAESFDYYLDLERCLSSAEVLDWLFQILDRSFGTPDDMADLMRALDDILKPQANLCSCGVSKTLKRTDIRQRVERLLYSQGATFYA